MSFKNAMAGLPMGGGKAVILADEARTKTPEMLAAYGKAIDGRDYEATLQVTRGSSNPAAHRGP